MKQLANQTANATGDIAGRIAELRNRMEQILKAMEASKSAVAAGDTAIGEAASNMDTIAGQIDHVSGIMHDICGILTQQDGAATEVSRNISRVASAAAENERLLTAMSGHLHESNTRFSGKAAQWHRAGDPRSLCQIAKIDHVLFKKCIIDAVTGHGHCALDELPDRHACRLGKWYDTLTDVKNTALPEFAALAAPHAKVHATAKAMLEAAKAGEATRMKTALHELSDASKTVLELLDRLMDALSRQEGAVGERRNAA